MSSGPTAKDLDKAALIAAIDMLESLETTYRGTREEIMCDHAITESAFVAMLNRLKAMSEGKELPPPPPVLELPKWEIQQYELIAMRYCVEAIDAASAVAEFLAGNVLRECGMVDDVVDICDKYGVKVSEDFAAELERRGVTLDQEAYGGKYLPSIRLVEPWEGDPEEDEEEKEFVPEDGEEAAIDPQTITRVKVYCDGEEINSWYYEVYVKDQDIASGELGDDITREEALTETCRSLRRYHKLHLTPEQFVLETDRTGGGAHWDRPKESP